MVKSFFVLMMMLIWAAPTAAMPSAEFASRWRAASRVPMAVGAEVAKQTLSNSTELRALAAEFNRALQQYRGQILAAKSAGTKLRSCPPKELDITVDGVIADMSSLPAGWQMREVSETFGEVMDRRFPCGSGTAHG